MKIKSFWRSFNYLLYLLVICTILLEALLRVLQYEPYHYQPFSLESNPKNCILPDTVLGFRPNAGHFQVKLNHDFTFETTHNANFQRICPDTIQADYQIQLYGCSYTYGFGVDDQFTTACQLQSLLGSSVEVSNLSVLGYGTVQAYLLLQEMVKQGKQPDLAIFHYASFHDDRNVLTPNYRKDLKNGFANTESGMQAQYQSLQFPYIHFQADTLQLKWEKWADIYKNWPLREHSALVNLLQTIADRYDWSHREKRLLTKLLLLELKQFCEKYNIELVIAGITDNLSTKELLAFCKLNKITAVDISIDLMSNQFNNFPHDSHPNAQAHHFFAKKLASFIKSKILNSER